MLFKKYYLINVSYYKPHSECVTFMDIMCDTMPSRKQLGVIIREVNCNVFNFSIISVSRLSKKEYQLLRM